MKCIEILLITLLCLMDCVACGPQNAEESDRLSVTLKADEPTETLLPDSVTEFTLTAVNEWNIDAYSFIEVTMPIVHKEIAFEKGTADAAFLAENGWAPVYSFDIGDGWALLSEEQKDGQLVSVYTYGTKDAPVALRPGEEATPLITAIRLANFAVRGKLCGEVVWADFDPGSPGFTAYSIQTKMISGTAEEIWSMLR